MAMFLGGCLGPQQPPPAITLNAPIATGVMPPPVEADLSQPDPKTVTSLKSGDSILVETPEDAAAARAQKRAMMKSVDKGATLPASLGGKP